MGVNASWGEPIFDPSWLCLCVIGSWQKHIDRCWQGVFGDLGCIKEEVVLVLVTAIAATISPSLWSASHTPLMVPRLNGDTKSVQDLHPLVLDQYLLCSLSSYSSTNCSSDVSKVFVENDGNVARQRHRCGLAGYHFSRVSQAVLLLP